MIISMNNKKRNLIIGTILVLVFSILVALSYANSDSGNVLGDIFKKYKVEKNVPKDKVLISEGEVEVTQNELITIKHLIRYKV